MKRADVPLAVAVLALVAFALSALCSCAAPDSDAPLEQQVASATVDGLVSVGFPEPPERCHVDKFQIEQPRSQADFLKLCPSNPNACFVWRLVTPRARRIEYPAAVIHPKYLDVDPEVDAVVARLAVHELDHAIYGCAIFRARWYGDNDVYDADHTDPRVWRKTGGAGSAEAIAIELLDAY